jgi:UDP-glucose 4-epimerase
MRDHGAGTYTITKTAVEDFVRMFNKYRDGRISTVRPVNAYGPRQSVAAPFGPSKVRKIMPAFICRALTGQPIEVYGDGTSISDCVYVEDVAETFVSALVNLDSGHNPDIYGVGPTVSHTVNDIAKMVAASAAYQMGNSLVDITHLPMRPGEVPNSVTKADTSNLKDLGIHPDSSFTSLEDGIHNTVDWFITNWLPGYLKAKAA